MCKNKRSNVNVPNVTNLLNQVRNAYILVLLFFEHFTSEISTIINKKNKLFKKCSIKLEGKWKNIHWGNAIVVIVADKIYS